MKIKMTSLVLAIILMCGCMSKHENGDGTNSANANVSSQEDNNAGLPSDEKQEIKNLVTAMWFQMPSGTNNIETISKFLTESFYSVLSEGNDKYKKLSNNENGDVEEIMGLAETVYGWWGGQDPNPNGEFIDISVVKSSENEAQVTVDYKNWSDTETHILYLKKINNKWLLDNFDNVKECIRECL